MPANKQKDTGKPSKQVQSPPRESEPRKTNISEKDILKKKELTQQDIHIDTEYKNLVPEPSAQEYDALKASIDKDGQRDPVIVNEEGVVIDGHNRFKILRELGKEIKYEIRQFPNKQAELDFLVEAALLRRNLNTFQRIKLLQPVLEIERTKAEARQKSGVGTLASIDAKVGKATEIVARKFGISMATFERGIHILKHASQAQIQKLEQGEATINGVCNQLFAKRKSGKKNEGASEKAVNSSSKEGHKETGLEEANGEGAPLDRKMACEACGTSSTRADLKQVLLGKECRRQLGMKW